MELLIFLIIVAIVIIVKASKKAKSKKIQEQFRANLLKKIELLEDNDVYFEERYNALMEGVGEITKPEIESILKRIPQLKTEFSSVCEKLINVSEKNICLTNDQQILNEFEEIKYFPEGNERISHDMMELLPLLADYFRLHKQLYSEIYRNVLMGKFHEINSCAFGFMIEKESEYASADDFNKKVNSCFDFVFFSYNLLVDQLICQTLKLPMSFDVRNSKLKEAKALISIADERETRKKFAFDAWFPKMQSIGKRYAEAHIDLYNYFNDIDSRLEAQIEWFSISYFFPPVGGMLYLKEYTQEECERILKLYKEGKIKGQNSFMY